MAYIYRVHVGIKVNNNPKVIINIKICAKQGSNLRILR